MSAELIPLQPITVDQWMAAEDCGLYMPRLEFARYLIATGRLGDDDLDPLPVRRTPAPGPLPACLIVAVLAVVVLTGWLS